MSKDSKSTEKSDAYKEVMPYLNLLLRVGLGMVISILVFFLIGLGLERKFPSGGIFVVGGIFIGVGGGFYRVYKEMMNMEKLEK